MDPDPVPAVFVSEIQDINRNNFFGLLFLLTFQRYIYNIFFKIKSHEEVTKQ
jgi:hypothetical protein